MHASQGTTRIVNTAKCWRIQNQIFELHLFLHHRLNQNLPSELGSLFDQDLITLSLGPASEEEHQYVCRAHETQITIDTIIVSAPRQCWQISVTLFIKHQYITLHFQESHITSNGIWNQAIRHSFPSTGIWHYTSKFSSDVNPVKRDEPSPELVTKNGARFFCDVNVEALLKPVFQLRIYPIDSIHKKKGNLWSTKE